MAEELSDKTTMERVEDAPLDAPVGEVYTAEEVRRVVRKLDWNLMPICFVLYTFSVLDRSNLGNAKTAGMDDDLHITSKQYSLLGTTFYIAYIVFQFTTLGWKMFPPHAWVAFVVFFWGVTSTLQSVCTNWAGLMACRFMLGIAETMFGPGVPLYFSFFYPVEKVGLRFGIFLSGSALANAYGGALAYALADVHSRIQSWRFLFIIEGVPTALIALMCWWFIPDSPSKARFLTPRERLIAEFYARRQHEDRQGTGLRLEHLFDAFKDYRNWIFALTNFSTNVSFASMPLFLPTIVSEMGAFTPQQSNGLSAPPYLLSFFLIILVAYLSDRLRMRGPFAVFFSLIACIGYIVVAVTETVAARYFGLFFVVMIFVTVAVNLVWNANSNENESKRAGGLWIIMTVGQCGTLLGTNMFPAQEGPRYVKGMWIGFAFSMLAAGLCAINSYSLYRENKRRDKLYGPVPKGQEGFQLPGQPLEATLRYII
ncbi:Major facilitator superfamily domain, general substrate transporter [Niveomyces insectorum RCEF 264]|uniref:Major facilitator superfamily domain, general substrate transporter n=1 Tax=Niveomyces insectorum RCEF 264 TaxID=1081102 RepID=A0A167RB80_9HYPO|nr:Major facilitator superfamily domain, general substrate transporter [Niveomyces insectorum RCEF 264]